MNLRQKNSNIDAGLNALEGISAQVKTSVAHQIRSVFFELNERNQSLVMQHRMMYTVLRTAPCENYKTYAQAVQRLVENQERLNEIALRTSTLISVLAVHNGDPAPLINEYLTSLRDLGPIPAELQAQGARAAIQQNRQAAEKWITRSIDGKPQEADS